MEHVEICSLQEKMFRDHFRGICVKYEGEWETIKDVEILPRINTVTFECESGKVFTALKDDDFEFNCSNKWIKKVPNCKRLKKVMKK